MVQLVSKGVITGRNKKKNAYTSINENCIFAGRASAGYFDQNQLQICFHIRIFEKFQFLNFLRLDLRNFYRQQTQLPALDKRHLARMQTHESMRLLDGNVNENLLTKSYAHVVVAVIIIPCKIVA